MQTFKQYFLTESGWNPQVVMRKPGDPGRTQGFRMKPREFDDLHTRIKNKLNMVDRLSGNIDSVDDQTAENTLDDLGHMFDKVADTTLKQDILDKYKTLRDMLKQKRAENLHVDCVQVVKEMYDLLFESK